jgi:hypothetical protein
VKLAGRNEILETFWKSVGPAVWTYTEIPKGQRYKLLMRLKIIKKSQSIPVWQWVISCLINVDFPLKKFILVSGIDPQKSFNIFQDNR